MASVINVLKKEISHFFVAALMVSLAGVRFVQVNVKIANVNSQSEQTERSMSELSEKTASDSLNRHVPRNFREILPFLIIITLIFSVLHFFIIWIQSSSFAIGPWQWWMLLLYVFGLLSMPASFVVSMRSPRGRNHWFTWIGFVWMGFFQINFFLCLSFFVISIFTDQILYLAPWLFCVSLFLAILALIQGLRDPAIKQYQIKAPTAISGFKIVQLSDVHLGMLYLDKKWLLRQIERVQNLNADVVVITGDLVEGAFAQVSEFVRELEKLQAPVRLYVTGNHEYIHGGEVWPDLMTKLGWQVLHNSSVRVPYKNGEILFAGVPDRMGPRFDPKIKSLPDVALHTKQAVDYKILLAHEPASVWDCKLEKPDMILSGHTHGGQIFPFGMFVRMVQPVVSHWKVISGIKVYAHEGTGFWGPPMRLGTRSEIAVIELKDSAK